MSTSVAFDIIVIGAGPAGQKAAVQGAKAGKRVALIERERGIGGSCAIGGQSPVRHCEKVPSTWIDSNGREKRFNSVLSRILKLRPS
jgi:predicted flavoprotein YhiN